MSVPMPQERRYICKYCHMRTVKRGLPLPGACARREKDRNGRPKPHVWVRDT